MLPQYSIISENWWVRALEPRHWELVSLESYGGAGICDR
jgi:hypothetical protein